MKIRKKVIDSHWAIYITLVSIICSFTFEKFLDNLAIADIQFPLIFKLFIVFGCILLTWHEYAIGTILYEWKIDIIDSAIPFILGASIYFLVNQLNQKNDPDFKFFIALAGFSGTAVIAYFNQMYKSKKYNRKQISMILSPNFFSLVISLSLTSMLLSLLAAFIIVYTNLNIEIICNYILSILIILIYSYFILKTHRIRTQIENTLDEMSDAEILDKYS